MPTKTPPLILEKIQETRKRIESLRKVLKEECKEAFSSISKSLFDQHPCLVSFSWTQYTPYFNDGHECVFCANKEYLDFVFKNSEGEEVDHEDIGPRSFTQRWDSEKRDFVKQKLIGDTALFAAAAHDAIALMKNFEDEDLKEMFGDHARVIVTKNKVEVEGYNHD